MVNLLLYRTSYLSLSSSILYISPPIPKQKQPPIRFESNRMSKRKQVSKADPTESLSLSLSLSLCGMQSRWLYPDHTVCYSIIDYMIVILLPFFFIVGISHNSFIWLFCVGFDVSGLVLMLSSSLPSFFSSVSSFVHIYFSFVRPSNTYCKDRNK